MKRGKWTVVAIVVAMSATLTPISLLIGPPSKASATIPNSWSITSSPNTSNNQYNWLFGISCVSASFCVAAGNYTASSGYDQTLIETWNGSSWSIVTSPNTSTSQNNDLTGVSCTSSSACTAVGSYMNSSSVQQTLIEAWNGTTWSIVSSPNGSSLPNVLEGVSCTSASNCTAVGLYQSGSYDLTLVESWNGTSWSIVSSPNTSPTQSNSLLAASCTSSSACTSTGDYWTGSDYQTLIETWNGSSWSIVTSPNTSSSQDNQLVSVSCTSTSACTAAGHYTASGGFAQTLIESWNGTSWSIVSSPNGSTTAYSELFGVSCTTASNCTAVGDYPDSGGKGQTMVQQWNGTSWAIVSSPDVSTTTDNALFAASCTSASACIAEGYYYNGNNKSQTLIESYGKQSPPYSVNPDGTNPGADAWGGGGGAVASCNCATGNPGQLGDG